MRRADVVSGVALAVFGLVMLFAVIPAQIDPGPPGIVSPRLVPNLMMGFVTVMAVALVLVNLRPARDRAEPAVPISRSELAALLKLGAVFAMALVLYRLVSPPAAGGGLVVGALLALGERRPLVLLLMPAALLTALWFVFYRVLGTAIV